MNKEFLAYLKPLISASKQEKMHSILAYRTNHITLVLEDLFQEHNISATMRSAEIFGVQNVHIIEQKNHYGINESITRGASQWLTVHRHKTTVEALRSLKQQGYRIVATVPDAQAQTLDDLNINNKIAFIFGTEYAGISQTALDMADEHITIPMFGFTKSFNVSVTAALCLHPIINKLHNSTAPWQLTEAEKDILFLEWISKSVAHFESHKNYFFNQKK